MEELTVAEQEKYELLINLINKLVYNKEYRNEIIKSVDELIEEIIYKGEEI